MEPEIDWTTISDSDMLYRIRTMMAQFGWLYISDPVEWLKQRLLERERLVLKAINGI